MAGATRIRLARALSSVLGHEVSPDDLSGARGWYRRHVADVMPWTGKVCVNGLDRSLGCWSTMTACLRHGFAVFNEQGNHLAYSAFDVSPFDDASGMDPNSPAMLNEVGRWLPKRLSSAEGREP